MRLRKRDDSQGGMLDLPLAQEADNSLTYLGDIPISGFDFEYGGAAMSWDAANELLYMTGLRTAQTLGRLTLPETVSSGSVSTSLAPVTITGTAGGGTGQWILSGSLVYGGRLIVAKSDDYDADDELGQSHWCLSMNLSMGSQGAMNTMNASNAAYVRRMSGAMGHIPAEWQELLGGPAFTTGCRLSIISRAQCGYGFGVFDPDDVSSSEAAVDVNVLLDYPYGNLGDTALEPGGDAYTGTRLVDGLNWSTWPKNANGGTDYFSSANAYLGTALIIPGSRTLAFITCHGYGTADNGCRPGSSINNSPYRMQVVAYDLADLVAVKNGEMETYEPQPYAWWELDNWSSIWNACVGNAVAPGNFCYLPDRGWLIGNANGIDGFPTATSFHVWEVATLT